MNEPVFPLSYLTAYCARYPGTIAPAAGFLFAYCCQLWVQQNNPTRVHLYTHLAKRDLGMADKTFSNALKDLRTTGLIQVHAESVGRYSPAEITLQCPVEAVTPVKTTYLFSTYVVFTGVETAKQPKQAKNAVTPVKTTPVDSTPVHSTYVDSTGVKRVPAPEGTFSPAEPPPGANFGVPSPIPPLSPCDAGDENADSPGERQEASKDVVISLNNLTTPFPHERAHVRGGGEFVPEVEIVEVEVLLSTPAKKETLRQTVRKKAPPSKPIAHPFAESHFANRDVFQTHFEKNFPDLDWEYYYREVSTWHDSKTGQPAKREIWASTINQFIKNDEKRNSLKFNQRKTDEQRKELHTKLDADFELYWSHRENRKRNQREQEERRKGLAR